MQTLKNNNKNQIISIPREIKKAIDTAFGDTYSNTDLEKIYFLYFKINKENNNYQINTTNHTWMLGFKNRSELSKILDKMVSIPIIKKVDNYQVGIKSNSYALLKTYDYKNENCYRINYYQGQVKFPVWVQKYIADGGIVKNKNTTNYVKPTPESKSTDDSKLVVELRAEIASLRAQLIQSNTSVVEGVLTPVEALFEPVKTDNKFNKKKVDEPHIYQYENENYTVDQWQLLLTSYEYTPEDLEEAIGESYSSKPIIVGNFKVKKTYDFNTQTFNVSIVNY